MSRKRPGPVVIDWPERADPAAAPPLDAGPAAPPPVPGPLPAARRWRLWGLILGLASAAAGLLLALWAERLLRALWAEGGVLGPLAAGLFALLLALLTLALLREGFALLRLRRLGRLRAAAQAALAEGDLAAARHVTAALLRLYQGRERLHWPRARLAESQHALLDADALLHQGERLLLEPLDLEARRAIESAARRVSMVTALVPLALADVLVAAFVNLRLLRQIAEIYGGRAGFWASLTLMRRLIAHLLATTALSWGDDLVQSAFGGGLAARLSRRLGEGVLNGALTARLGLAAMEACRPLPFSAMPPPRLSALMGGAFGGLWPGRAGGAPKKPIPPTTDTPGPG